MVHTGAMAFQGVRPARPSDVEAIADLQFTNWHAISAPLLPESVLAGLDRTALAAEWGAAVAMPSSGRILVAVDGEMIVGLAAFQIFGSTAELELFLIHPDAFGQGHGSRLMAAFADHLRSADCSAAVMWLVVGDAPLQKFLESTGWGTDGATRVVEDDAGNLLEQVRLSTTFDPQ
jgi:GNAT superfamily N-acetyltransferase